MITSKDNAMVKETRRLKETKTRRETGLFLAEGAHLVRELIASGFNIVRVFASGEGLRDEEQLIINRLLQDGVTVIEVSANLLKSLSETETPQGLIAVAEVSKYNGLPKPEAHQSYHVIVIDKVQDPGNLGTLIRTAWGFGFDLCILSPGTTDPYSGKVLRASMGGVFHLPIITATPIEVMRWSEDNDILLYGGDSHTEKRIDQVSYPKRLGVLVGNEGAGLSSEWYQSQAVQMVGIPMPGGAESLNVAVAASIMMYEVNRQLR